MTPEKKPARKPAREAVDRKAPRRPRRADALADPSTAVTPSARETAATATLPAATEAPISEEQLAASILRVLRRFPNLTVDLGPLAEELTLDPFRVQLAVERLGRRGLVVVPFIEPGTAGGATLTERGLRWLIDREGGRPADVPAALKPARDRVRAQDEAARLPRAQVYGVRR
ncbi:MAG: hypothetical protein ACRDHD_08800 [Candidatus Limnocylindria bacterium]